MTGIFLPRERAVSRQEVREMLWGALTAGTVLLDPQLPSLFPKTGDGRGHRSSGSRDRSREPWGPASTLKRRKPQHSLSSLLSLWKIVLS